MVAVLIVAAWCAAAYAILMALKHVTRTPPASFDDDAGDELADAWLNIVRAERDRENGRR